MLFIAAMILSAAMIACYGAIAGNEKKEIQKVVATYFEGVRTENLDLLMSVISPSFLWFATIGNKTGVRFNYEQDKEGEGEFFKNNNILNCGFEITKIEVMNDKARVETNTSLKWFSLKESKQFKGSRPFFFFLKKEKDKWLITNTNVLVTELRKAI